MATMKEVEVSHVSPTPGSVPTTSLNLTLFDIPMLGFSAMQRLYFYEFPHPTSYFMETTLPNLKASLSLTLQHFFPFAGKLLLPPPPQPLPYLMYKEGDSVSVIVKESTADHFNHLIGDHPRHVEELRALVPTLPSPSMTPSGCREKLLMAIQITVFPMAGICIGVGYHHGAADARTLTHFLKSWANTHKSHGEYFTLLNNNNSLPYFNRDLIQDPSGLASKFFNAIRETKEVPWIPVDKLRVTLNINKSQVLLLKDWIAKNLTEEDKPLIRLSTFVVTCAYMWVCLVKLQDPSNHGDDARCHFIISADCRERLKLPTTYFGNCISIQFVSAKKSELTGENGIVVATMSIGKQLMELEEKGPLNEAEKWLSRMDEIFKSGDQIEEVKTLLSSNSETNKSFGKLSLPPPPQPLPYFVYEEGDSVSFIVKESRADFNHLIGDHPRHVEELRALVPTLPPPSMAANGSMEKPVMAIQITVFPMAGICIGVAFCHSVADGNCRERLKLPTTYFGNCIAMQFVAAKKSELITGENGIVVAARAIGRQVMELDKGPLNEAEKWSSRIGEIIKSGGHITSVTSSPKLGAYKIDFGWGRAKKTEAAINIGSTTFFSLTESREEEGGVELGLALPSDKLDCFNSIFFQGLSNLI
ncbi:Transferase [Corchorus olitorius]|uniref:Transferase n=1 Tax=Corchorus olitorius TaxID=93759 RepID=A0A1R3GI04_9ROSI|nr:Transferase [Corchorus olitorius]